MNRVEEAVKCLIAAIKESDIYVEYQKQLAEVNKCPALKSQIDEYRTRNFQLQNSPDYALDKLEQFDREYEDLVENPLVSEFLAAELAFCRMMQEMNSCIIEAVQFD